MTILFFLKKSALQTTHRNIEPRHNSIRMFVSGMKIL